MSSESIEGLLSAIGMKLRERSDRIIQEELGRMREEAPVFFASDDPDYVARYTASCVAHLNVLVDQLRSGRDVPASLPAAADEETRTVAQWGIPVEALIQTYRTAHSVIWEHAMDLTESTITEDKLRAQALVLVSRYLFSYTDKMVAMVKDVYEDERTAMFHDRDRKRRQLVRDILDGLPVDYRRLAYLIPGHHMAAIASGPGADRALGKLAAEFGLTVLTVPGPSESIWGWMEGPSLEDSTVQDRVIAHAPVGIFLAFGEVAKGVDGFRISHGEARQAHRVGRLLNARVVRYKDVALLALTTMDDSLAKRFIKRELGYLADDNVRVAELRQTLRAYFDAGHNASAAAAQLSLNDRTVAYRLRTMEQELGRPILARRDELSAALRLFDLYYTHADETHGSSSEFR